MDKPIWRNPDRVAIDATGVYAVLRYSNGAPGLLVRKWDAIGNPLWSRALNSTDITSSGTSPTFTSASPAGFYLIGTDARGSGSFLRQYDADGVELWSRKLEPFAIDIVADSTGVYVGGPMPVAYQPYRPLTVLPGQCRSGSGGDTFVRKFDNYGSSTAGGASLNKRPDSSCVATPPVRSCQRRIATSQYRGYRRTWKRSGARPEDPANQLQKSMRSCGRRSITKGFRWGRGSRARRWCRFGKRPR